MNTVDMSYKLLQEEGYTGSYDDMVYKKLKDLTGLSSSTPDMWYEWLRSLGYTGGLNDMLYQHLRGKGYTGTLADMLNTASNDRNVFYPNEGLVADFSLDRFVIAGETKEDTDAFNITRSSSKYVWGTGAQTGQLVEVPPNTPAYQHDPVTGAPLGLSVEGSATNLLTHSKDFSQSAWVKTTVSATITTNEAPLVGNYFTKIIGNNGVLSPLIAQSCAISAGKTYTTKLFVKAAELDAIQINYAGAGLANFFLDDGSVEVNASGLSGLIENVSASIKNVDNDVFVIAAKFDCVGSVSGSLRFYLSPTKGVNPSFQPSYVGDGVSGIEIWQADLQDAGNLNASPIITENSTLTRAADIVTSDAATFGGWYRTSGTLTVTAKANVGDLVARLGNIDIVADVDTEKEYSVTYTTDPLATELELLPSGNGYIKQVTFKE